MPLSVITLMINQTLCVVWNASEFTGVHVLQMLAPKYQPAEWLVLYFLFILQNRNFYNFTFFLNYHGFFAGFSLVLMVKEHLLITDFQSLSIHTLQGVEIETNSFCQLFA